MPQITDPAVLELPVQQTLYLSVQTSVSELPARIAESYQKIGEIIASEGVFLAGIPYVCYLNMDMDDLRVEIGMPVAKRIEGRDDVKAGEIPAGKYAVCMHLGPYDQIEPTYEALGKWVTEQGFTPTGISYEYYLNGPNHSPEQYLTEVRFPLK